MEKPGTSSNATSYVTARFMDPPATVFQMLTPKLAATADTPVFVPRFSFVTSVRLLVTDATVLRAPLMSTLLPAGRPSGKKPVPEPLGADTVLVTVVPLVLTVVVHGCTRS